MSELFKSDFIETVRSIDPVMAEIFDQDTNDLRADQIDKFSRLAENENERQEWLEDLKYENNLISHVLPTDFMNKLQIISDELYQIFMTKRVLDLPPERIMEVRELRDSERARNQFLLQLQVENLRD